MRIAPKRVNPLSIVRANTRMIGICSIETVKLQFGKIDGYISFQYWVDANNAKQKFKI
jgi:hypothetical protein